MWFILNTNDAGSPRGRLEVVTLRSPRGGHLGVRFRWHWSWGQLEVALSSRGRLRVRLAVWCGILDRCAVPRCGVVRTLCSVGWRCDAVALLDRYVVLRCGVVPVFACKVCRPRLWSVCDLSQTVFVLWRAAGGACWSCEAPSHLVHSGGGLASKGAVHQNVQSALQWTRRHVFGMILFFEGLPTTPNTLIVLAGGIRAGREYYQTKTAPTHPPLTSLRRARWQKIKWSEGGMNARHLKKHSRFSALQKIFWKFRNSTCLDCPKQQWEREVTLDHFRRKLKHDKTNSSKLDNTHAPKAPKFRNQTCGGTRSTERVDATTATQNAGV